MSELTLAVGGEGGTLRTGTVAVADGSGAGDDVGLGEGGTLCEGTVAVADGSGAGDVGLGAGGVTVAA